MSVTADGNAQPLKRRKLAVVPSVPAPENAPSSSPSSASALSSSSASVIANNADHYSQRVRNQAERSQSSILALRSFNNWVKSVLLSSVLSSPPSPPSPFVLDICGGKGGDLKKFDIAGIGHLTLADHASGSVRDAVERFHSIRCSFPAAFVAADCHRALLSSALPPSHAFDVASCQFALHYAFETEETARNFMLNVTERLRPGGRFVCTVPDAFALVGWLRRSPGLTFGNSRMTVRFPDLDEKAEREGEGAVGGKWCFPPSRLFGLRYFFRLEDAIDDLPEYLVHPVVLESLAAQYGLQLQSSEALHDFVYAHIDDDDNYALLRKMGLVDAALPNGTALTQDEWDVLNVYRAIVFPQAHAGRVCAAHSATAAAVLHPSRHRRRHRLRKPGW